MSTNTQNTFPIIGIGASAGGLEPLQRFLGVLPKEFNFALVFVQHLSSKHKSLLQDLLAARLPSLAIQEISDGLKALPGRLYLAPPGREVRLKEGFFETTVHTEGLIHLPIDEFFASLAEDAGERAIAVVFSGAGTDGARGCQAVRSAGGTIYVQAPETAEFDSMPAAAIATGQADAVLSPEDICREILKVESAGAVSAGSMDAVTPEEHDEFFRVLFEKTGARFNHYKKSVVNRRIRRRMYLHGLATVKEYLALVSSRDNEAISLASDLMIGVTSFFRDRVAWKALNAEVVRRLAAENTTQPVRVWAPASATGEEAYSITMMLSHELALAGKIREIQVFATDVNDRALERAREGKYPASISADVPREYAQKYFTSTDDGRTLTVTKEIRERVVVAKQDLLTDPPFSRLDLILCRNFLIYLEPEAQEKCISLFHYALKDGGALFLGNAETVGRRSTLFKGIGRKLCRIYRKVEAGAAPRLPLSVPYASERSPVPAPARASFADRQGAMGLVQEFLLEAYAPAAIAIDQNYDIVYHNGPTNRYLRQPRGIPTQNLLELLPETLRNRVRGAIYRSGQEGKPVTIRANMQGDNNRKSKVSLRISKVKENLFAVVFQEKGGVLKLEEAAPIEAERVEETAVHQLESELSATRQDLQTHIEQLKSLNEELQSSNEELQAANEELETSREELQSLNEELVTVNSQLQTKIEEQDETNNDLNNFLTSTNIPTMFLDHQFKVKRFTPAMLKLIKLLPSDVGRPIADMSQEHLGPDLIVDSQTVLETLVPIRKEILINDTWFVRTTLPYRTADNRIDGVVVTYGDVTELKSAEAMTGRLAAIVESADDAIISKDPDGVIQTWNIGAEKIFGYTAAEATGKNISFLVPPGFKDETPGIIPRILQGEHVDHFESLRMRKDGAVIPVSLTYSAIRDANGMITGISKIAHDISERKKAEEALKESEHRYHSLFDNMTEGFAYCEMINDDQGRPIDFAYLEVNSAFGRLTGLTDVVGKKVTDVIPGIRETDPKLFELYARVSTTCKSERSEFYVEALKMWFSLSVYCPQIGYFVAVFDVITDRKKAEEALRQAHAELERRVEERTRELAIARDSLRTERQRLFDVMETLPVYVILLTRDHRVAFANRFFRERFGEDRGKTCYDFLFKRAEPCENCETYKVMETRAPHHWEWTGPDERDYDIFDYPFTDVDGSPLILEMGIDVTERKQAETALKELNETLEQRVAERTKSLQQEKDKVSALVSSITDEVWFADTNRKFTLANPSALRHFGIDAESELDIERFAASLEILRPDGSPRPVEETPPLRALQGEVVVNQEEIIRMPGKGELRYREVSAAPVRDTSGNIIGSVSVVRDVTERKKAETELLRLSEDMAARNLELEDKNKELEAFMYSISHDLRAPLRSMSGFSRIVMEDYAEKLGDQGKDYLTRIRNGSEKMTHLIDDLLHLSKISRQSLDRVDYDLSKLAESVVHNLREASPERNVEVVIREGVRASVDPSLMRVVMTNLLDNAWKFTSKTQNAKIEFGVFESQVSSSESQVLNSKPETRNSQLVYFVKDNGAGFDQQYAYKMFWPFHRLHGEKEFPGTGIGLAIVDRIVRRHGGKVWAEGEVEKGAIFYFTL